MSELNVSDEFLNGTLSSDDLSGTLSSSELLVGGISSDSLSGILSSDEFLNGVLSSDELNAILSSDEFLVGGISNVILRGYSAYYIAVLNGFSGTIEEWLNSLKGADGDAGNGIYSIKKIYGDSSPGTIDTYQITLTDNTTFSFDVYNGKDGVIQLGNTSTTAFPGDKGEIAYQHSISSHAPVNAEKNIINSVSLGGIGALTITDKNVDVPIAGDALGVVRSGALVNEVKVNSDGVMYVDRVSVKVLENDDTSLILDSNI